MWLYTCKRIETQKQGMWARWPVSICYINYISLSILVSLGFSDHNLEMFSLYPISCALMSNNSLTLNNPVNPKGNIRAVLNPFRVHDGPANCWQTLVMVDVEIGSFFVLGFVKALLLASTMFADRVVSAGLPFTSVGIGGTMNPFDSTKCLQDCIIIIFGLWYRIQIGSDV
jgi:hypothetical protein